jgi:heptosyltransferase-3
VIDLRRGDRGAILSFLTGAPIRIGNPGGKKQFWRKFLFTRIIHNQQVAPLPVHPGADQSLRIVRELGMNVADSNPKLYIAPADQARAKIILSESGIAPESGFVTVNPYSRWKYKEWSDEKWSAVIDQIWEAKKLPAILIGSPQEAAASQDIVAGREGRAVNLAGKTTLGEVAALISMSRLHLGVDSAAPHIAAAVNTPTVTIHGPTDWRAWRIVNDRHKVISPRMDCVPCNNTGCEGKGKSRCLDELDVEPVVRTALELLEHGKTSDK